MKIKSFPKKIAPMPKHIYALHFTGEISPDSSDKKIISWKMRIRRAGAANF